MYPNTSFASWLSLMVVANKAAALALPPNQSTVLTAQLNDTGNNPKSYPGISYHCTSSPTWYPYLSDRSKFDEDCEIAYDDMDMTDFLTHDDVSYEFLSEGARPSESGMETMRTPRRYTFGQ